MNIEYKNVQEFIGWDKAEAIIQKLILENNFKSILELGAGANPTIQLDFIKTNKLNYTISDIDSVELAKAGDIYSKEVLNLNTKEIPHSKNMILFLAEWLASIFQMGVISIEIFILY